ARVAADLERLHVCPGEELAAELHLSGGTEDEGAEELHGLGSPLEIDDARRIRRDEVAPHAAARDEVVVELHGWRSGIDRHAEELCPGESTSRVDDAMAVTRELEAADVLVGGELGMQPQRLSAAIDGHAEELEPLVDLLVPEVDHARSVVRHGERGHVASEPQISAEANGRDARIGGRDEELRLRLEATSIGAVHDVIPARVEQETRRETLRSAQETRSCAAVDGNGVQPTAREGDHAPIRTDLHSL